MSLPGLSAAHIPAHQHRWPGFYRCLSKTASTAVKNTQRLNRWRRTEHVRSGETQALRWDRYLCAGLKVGMRERPWPLKELFDVIPSTFPFTAASTDSVNNHAGEDRHIYKSPCGVHQKDFQCNVVKEITQKQRLRLSTLGEVGAVPKKTY